MAGTWIIMKHDLPSTPEVKRITRATGAECAALTVGRLHAVWVWADKQTEDGRVQAELADVDDEAGCDGFAQAMVDAGWLSVDGDTLVFPNFGDHNGKTAKTRAKAFQRQQRRRSEKRHAPVTVQRDNVTVDRDHTEQNSTKNAAHSSPQSPPKGGVSPPNKQQPYTPEFQAWWKTYPARDGCPPGNKRAAFREWLKLGADSDNAVRQQIHRATKALCAATTAGETKPKDAERFLRPPRGGGDPPYLGWLEAKAPTGARCSPSVHLNDQYTIKPEDPEDDPIAKARAQQTRNAG